MALEVQIEMDGPTEECPLCEEKLGGFEETPEYFGGRCATCGTLYVWSKEL